MRTREFKFYPRLGGAVWKNGEYLIEGKLNAEGETVFSYWLSLDARVIGEAHTLDEAIDDCAEHRRGQKILRFAAPDPLPGTPEERNPFAKEG
jgi:hypothetical protein